MTTRHSTVAVMGAYGHTARFVLPRLRERGLVPIPVGRNRERLHALGGEPRVASADDPASLDRAFTGVAAVVNCAPRGSRCT